MFGVPWKGLLQPQVKGSRTKMSRFKYEEGRDREKIRSEGTGTMHRRGWGMGTYRGTGTEWPRDKGQPGKQNWGTLAY